MTPAIFHVREHRMAMNSKGFRMRRDREAKQELGITDNEQIKEANPERPLTEQSLPVRRSHRRLSLFRRIWQAIWG
jgi:hypothetical protein